MVSGPLAAMLLADLGADVVKIEQPVGGDRMRYLGNRRGGIGALWANVNRGKRSVCIDLAKPAGVEIVKRLAASADVFVQNFRPGVVTRLGIDEAALRAVNDQLIYVSISGFGESGPYVDQKSYDYVIQALSGMAALQRDPDTGAPALLRNIVIDKVTAYTVAQSVTAALLARERGAGGQHVRVRDARRRPRVHMARRHDATHVVGRRCHRGAAHGRRLHGAAHEGRVDRPNGHIRSPVPSAVSPRSAPSSG